MSIPSKILIFEKFFYLGPLLNSFMRMTTIIIIEEGLFLEFLFSLLYNPQIEVNVNEGIPTRMCPIIHRSRISRPCRFTERINLDRDRTLFYFSKKTITATVNHWGCPSNVDHHANREDRNRTAILSFFSSFMKKSRRFFSFLSQ